MDQNLYIDVGVGQRKNSCKRVLMFQFLTCHFESCVEVMKFICTNFIIILPSDLNLSSDVAMCISQINLMP